MLGYAHPVAKCFASIALMSPMYTHTPNGVCVHDETGSAGCEFPHKIHTQWWGYSPLCVCAYICVKMFIHLSTRLRFQYSLRTYKSLLMCCVCCRINQLNYLWWWINRFVFRWRAQLAALSTTNCRRIEWWNLERERVLGQSQCYSWIRGFFLTQLRVRDTVAIRYIHQQWWIGSLPSY